MMMKELVNKALEKMDNLYGTNSKGSFNNFMDSLYDLLEENEMEKAEVKINLYQKEYPDFAEYYVMSFTVSSFYDFSILYDRLEVSERNFTVELAENGEINIFTYSVNAKRGY